MIETPQEKTPLETRQSLWLLYAPMAAGVGIILAVVLVLVVPGSWLRLNKWELSIVGDTIIVLMALCPLFICNFALLGILAAGVIGMFWAHNKTSGLFGRAQELTHSIAEKTQSTAADISQRSIGISARFAFVNQIINIFDRPPKDGTKTEGLEHHE